MITKKRKFLWSCLKDCWIYKIPKIRKSIILKKEGIFQRTFKLPFSRFHAVFSHCLKSSTKMGLLFTNLRGENMIFHPFFNVKTYFTLSRLLIQLITGKYSRQTQLIVRSVGVKSELPLSTLSDPFTGNTDEFENKPFHS